MHNFITALQRTKMTSNERGRVKRALLNHIKMNPVTNEAVGGRLSFAFVYSRPVMVAMIFLIVTLSAAGVCYAAESALPGDLLYPVKTGINEGVRSLVNVSAIDEANWQVERTDRRLAEMEQLTASDQLSAEAADQLSESISAYAEKVQQYAQEFAEAQQWEKAVSVNTRLESTLRVHGNLISAINAQNAESVSSVNQVMDTIGTSQQQAADFGTVIEQELAETADADQFNQLKEAERVLQETEILRKAVDRQYVTQEQIMDKRIMPAAPAYLMQQEPIAPEPVDMPEPGRLEFDDSDSQPGQATQPGSTQEMPGVETQEPISE